MRKSLAYVSAQHLRKSLKYKALRRCVSLRPYRGRVQPTQTGCDGLVAPFKAPLMRALQHFITGSTGCRPRGCRRGMKYPAFPGFPAACTLACFRSDLGACRTACRTRRRAWASSKRFSLTPGVKG